jgi:hypothetical protein
MPAQRPPRSRTHAGGRARLQPIQEELSEDPFKFVAKIPDNTINFGSRPKFTFRLRLASWGRRRDCLLSWLAVATTFDGLNAVDGRSGEFKNGADPENRPSPPAALRRRFSSAMRLQSMIGNTAPIIESEMFVDRCTLRQ